MGPRGAAAAQAIHVLFEPHACCCSVSGEFEAWAKQNAHFKLIASVTQAAGSSWPYEVGRVNRELLTRHVPEPDRAIYYLAGPPAMVAGMRQLLDSLGVSEDSLKTEEFAGY